MESMEGFQGVRDDQVKANIYIFYTALVPINGFLLKEIKVKRTQPLLTVQNARRILTCCWVLVYHLHPCHHSMHDRHLLPLHESK